ncbi:hypothetical protein B9G53_13280 [Pseudanabaena sp. SR411]|nr:hypothetical protein B9G53_13280 [Pseudanabaena sp. SR411]
MSVQNGLFHPMFITKQLLNRQFGEKSVVKAIFGYGTEKYTGVQDHRLDDGHNYFIEAIARCKNLAITLATIFIKRLDSESLWQN